MNASARDDPRQGRIQGIMGARPEGAGSHPIHHDPGVLFGKLIRKPLNGERQTVHPDDIRSRDTHDLIGVCKDRRRTIVLTSLMAHFLTHRVRTDRRNINKDPLELASSGFNDFNNGSGARFAPTMGTGKPREEEQAGRAFDHAFTHSARVKSPSNDSSRQCRQSGSVNGNS